MKSFRPRLSLPLASIRETNSEAELISQFEGMNRPIRDLSFVSKTVQHSFVQGLKVESLTISEAHMDPMVINTRSEPRLSFNIPFSGDAILTERTRATPFPSSQHIVICPFRHESSFKTSGYHSPTYHPDRDAINSAVSKYVPDTDKLLDNIIPEYASSHTGHLGDVNYHDQLMLLLSIVNSCNGGADFPKRIGFDEVVTMVLAEFMVQATGTTLDGAKGAPSRRSDRAVNIICDYIVNYIGTPLTIPQMETLTGMTGRAISYAFHARFGRSPQQWQRDYLLDLARQELTHSTAPRSVKSIAFDLGFSSPSSFSAHYKKRFGEHPSLTLHATPRSPHLTPGGKDA